MAADGPKAIYCHFDLIHLPYALTCPSTYSPPPNAMYFPHLGEAGRGSPALYHLIQWGSVTTYDLFKVHGEPVRSHFLTRRTQSSLRFFFFFAFACLRSPPLCSLALCSSESRDEGRALCCSFSGFGKATCSNLPTFELSNFSTFQLFKLSNLQTFQLSNLITIKLSNSSRYNALGGRDAW